jgi:hypothetical protein
MHRAAPKYIGTLKPGTASIATRGPVFMQKRLPTLGRGHLIFSLRISILAELGGRPL